MGELLLYSGREGDDSLHTHEVTLMPSIQAQRSLWRWEVC
jgi:hypothetical protein